MRRRHSTVLRPHHAALAASETGSSLVEFALTLPILLTVVFGLMRVCLAFYTYEWLSECAREGTRYAIVRGSTCMLSSGASCTATAANVNTYVAGLGFPNLGSGAINVATTYPDGDEVPGHRVLVNATYSFHYKIPFATSRFLALSTSSEMEIVQ